MQKVNKIGNWQTKAYHRELGLPGTELFYSSFIIYVKRSKFKSVKTESIRKLRTKERGDKNVVPEYFKLYRILILHFSKAINFISYMK